MLPLAPGGQPLSGAIKHENPAGKCQQLSCEYYVPGGLRNPFIRSG